MSEILRWETATGLLMGVCIGLKSIRFNMHIQNKLL